MTDMTSCTPTTAAPGRRVNPGSHFAGHDPDKTREQYHCLFLANCLPGKVVSDLNHINGAGGLLRSISDSLNDLKSLILCLMFGHRL